MKKFLLVCVMIVIGVSSSYAYDNGIGVITSPTQTTSVDSETAVINQYCEIRFQYIIDKGYLGGTCYGSVYLKHGGQTIAGTQVYGDINFDNTGWYDEYLTGQWNTLELVATGYNAYAHGLLYW